MSKLPVSVIIVAKESASTIEECLIAIIKNNPSEIIVIDGNSTDETMQIARKYTEKVYSDDGKGLCFARQLGVEQATQEYIAYVDSDVVLIEDALSIMYREFMASDCISLVAQEAPNRNISGYWEWAQYEHNQFRRGQCSFGTIAGIMKKETILKFGFNQSSNDIYSAMDDMDMEIRLRKAGYKFGTSSAIYYHSYKSDFKSFVRYRFFMGRLTACYIKKYGPCNVGFWPPLSRLYWLGLFLIKGKPKLIPYIIVDGMMQTAGMLRELLGTPGKDTSEKR